MIPDPLEEQGVFRLITTESSPQYFFNASLVLLGGGGDSVGRACRRSLSLKTNHQSLGWSPEGEADCSQSPWCKTPIFLEVTNFTFLWAPEAVRPQLLHTEQNIHLIFQLFHWGTVVSCEQLTVLKFLPPSDTPRDRSHQPFLFLHSLQNYALYIQHTPSRYPTPMNTAWTLWM